MEQTSSNTKDLLGLQQKHEFLVVMDSLFPDQDLLSENGKFRKRADLAFDLMIKLEWTVKEFQKTMSEFIVRWTSFSWMPAHLIELKKKLFPEDEMII